MGYVLTDLPAAFSTPGVTVVLARGGCRRTVIRIWVAAEDFKGRPAAALFARYKARVEVPDRTWNRIAFDAISNIYRKFIETLLEMF